MIDLYKICLKFYNENRKMEFEEMSNTAQSLAEHKNRLFAG